MKTVKIIPSKSDAHRAYISAALAYIQNKCMKHAAYGSSESEKNNLEDSEIFGCVICDETSEDIEATKRCLQSIVSAIVAQETRVESDGTHTATVDLYCGESGSTLRFLLPIVGALGKACSTGNNDGDEFSYKAIFHPEGRLVERPMEALIDELCNHGMKIHYQNLDENQEVDNKNSDTVIVAEGNITSGTYTIPGNISSQYISGLLFALPLLEGDSEIIVEGTLESSPYVDMTVDTLGRYGISIEDETVIELCGNSHEPKETSSGNRENYTAKRLFYVKGNQIYKAPDKYKVQGDWSNAAFWFAIGTLGNEPIRVEGLSTGTFQGDERIWDAIDVFGIEYGFGRNYVEVHPSREKMRGITWDASETPDMVPVISLLGAMSKGETRIVNAARLRLKESDRLHTVSETLKALGVMVEELPDGLIVYGCSKFSVASLDSYGDHRIAMMIAAASTALEGSSKIKLSGWKAANKSYPTFFEELSELGFDAHLELI